MVLHYITLHIQLQSLSLSLSLSISDQPPMMPSSNSYTCLSIFSLLHLILLSLSSTSAHAQAPLPPPAPSVYDILPKFGLPRGLLPDCVTRYSYNPDDGTFVVELDQTCYVQFEYLVYYDKRITGTLKLGSITNLKGIQVKRFFLWFDVDEIKVDLPPSDSIYFQVGLINKKLSVAQFQTIHSCKSGVSVSYSSRSWNLPFELPPAVDDEIPMLLTE
ncbi:hypothetical protein Cgig2_016908 [Carnegiea gigantea]|uniref:Uncharacterized protein n=1 Tax=Carnegiea gigantea TaxID=171969 RepID=A0A9Q1K5F4_9CARY|nr:hypothetical protein Cgig2_016908 [Carnegiea gigantea]